MKIRAKDKRGRANTKIVIKKGRNQSCFVNGRNKTIVVSVHAGKSGFMKNRNREWAIGLCYKYIKERWTVVGFRFLREIDVWILTI